MSTWFVSPFMSRDNAKIYDMCAGLEREDSIASYEWSVAKSMVDVGGFGAFGLSSFSPGMLPSRNYLAVVAAIAGSTGPSLSQSVRPFGNFDAFMGNVQAPWANPAIWFGGWNCYPQAMAPSGGGGGDGSSTHASAGSGASPAGGSTATGSTSGTSGTTGTSGTSGTTPVAPISDALRGEWRTKLSNMGYSQTEADKIIDEVWTKVGGNEDNFSAMLEGEEQAPARPNQEPTHVGGIPARTGNDNWTEQFGQWFGQRILGLSSDAALDLAHGTDAFTSRTRRGQTTYTATDRYNGKADEYMAALRTANGSSSGTQGTTTGSPTSEPPAGGTTRRDLPTGEPPTLPQGEPPVAIGGTGTPPPTPPTGPLPEGEAPAADAGAGATPPVSPPTPPPAVASISPVRTEATAARGIIAAITGAGGTPDTTGQIQVDIPQGVSDTELATVRAAFPNARITFA